MRVSKLVVLMIVLLLISALPSLAAEKGRVEPFTVVTSEELKAMLDRKEPGMVIIDARDPEEYQQEHIRTAVNVPWSKLEKDKGLLDFPKEAKLVFYCNGFK
jgi:3-mercaptopyruvate sulfurtransferase SseA